MGDGFVSDDLPDGAWLELRPDLDDYWPPAEPALVETPRKCKRHDWRTVQGGYGDAAAVTLCDRCGKERDEAASARGRKNKNRGNAIQRKQIEALGGQNLAGNNPNLDGIGIAFRYESKSGGIFSERLWRYLSGIPLVAGQTGVLIVTETPGSGRKARSYVVVSFDDWRSLHGEARFVSAATEDV